MSVHEILYIYIASLKTYIYIYTTLHVVAGHMGLRIVAIANSNYLYTRTLSKYTICNIGWLKN